MDQQAISIPAQDSKRTPRTERRAWVRLPCDLDIRCRSIADMAKDKRESGWLGRVRNISQGGIALVLRRRLEPGTELIIEVATKAGQLRRLRAGVVHATLERNGQWIVGCSFASALGQEELEAFLKE